MKTCHLCGCEVDDFIGHCTGCMAAISEGYENTALHNLCNSERVSDTPDADPPQGVANAGQPTLGPRGKFNSYVRGWKDGAKGTAQKETGYSEDYRRGFKDGYDARLAAMNKASDHYGCNLRITTWPPNAK